MTEQQEKACREAFWKHYDRPCMDDHREYWWGSGIGEKWRETWAIALATVAPVQQSEAVAVVTTDKFGSPKSFVYTGVIFDFPEGEHKLYAATPSVEALTPRSSEQLKNDQTFSAIYEQHRLAVQEVERLTAELNVAEIEFGDVRDSYDHYKQEAEKLRADLAKANAQITEEINLSNDKGIQIIRLTAELTKSNERVGELEVMVQHWQGMYERERDICDQRGLDLAKSNERLAEIIERQSHFDREVQRRIDSYGPLKIMAANPKGFMEALQVLEVSWPYVTIAYPSTAPATPAEPQATVELTELVDKLITSVRGGCYLGKDEEHKLCDEIERALNQCQAVKAEPKIDHYSGNWDEDLSHENGNYNCRCISCGLMFLGHKRRVACKLCASNKPEPLSAAQGVPEGMVLVSKEIIDRFPELNMANYNYDDVDDLNNWAVELVLSAAPEQSTPAIPAPSPEQSPVPTFINQYTESLAGALKALLKADPCFADKHDARQVLSTYNRDKLLMERASHRAASPNAEHSKEEAK